MKKSATIILLIFIFSFSYSQEFYVSKTGNDKNNGSKSKPFATLERARNEVRTYKKKNGIPKSGITVWIGKGTYTLNKTFELGPEDAGRDGSPVVYHANLDEEVNIIGGVKIEPSQFKKVSDKNILNRFSPEVRDKILYADLKAMGVTTFGEIKQIGHGLAIVPSPAQLYIDNKQMQLSRYPNKGAITIGKVIDPGSVPRYGDYSNRGGTFEYTDDRHKNWLLNDDVWLQGTFKYGYADDLIKIQSVDTNLKTIKLATPHVYGIGTGEPFNEYIAYNILEEIDSMGEYYVDKKSGYLYFYPPCDLSKSNIQLSLLDEPMVAIENTSFITIRDITFEATRGMGIYIEGGQNNLIAGCTVRNIGTVGIMMGQGSKREFLPDAEEKFKNIPTSRHVGTLQAHLYTNTVWDRKAGKNHGVLSCNIYNTGSGGVILSGGSKKDLINGNCFVKNCVIHDFQLRNKAHAAAINVDGCGNIVSHNDIYNAEQIGILANGNEHLYEYNTIHDVSMNCNDGSAWYTGRDPSNRGTIIRYNFFHHIGRLDRKWIMGVYFDDAACGGLVYGNVFHKAGTYGSVYSNAGQDIKVQNNIFTDCSGPVFLIKAMWWDFAIDQWDEFFGEKGIYRKRLTEMVDIKKPPYSTKYPELVNWLDLTADGKTYNGMYPERNVVCDNLIYKYDETFRMVAENAKAEYKNNYITSKNPGFIDEKNLNFQLSDTSIVYKKIPGFKKIPFEEIGLYKDEYRKTIK
jgi:hypothetical protein